MDKPALPKGTRDFGPAIMAKRQFILENIKKVFQKYGFMPLETPAMENLETLTGKYGDEGDQLLFKILNSGDFLKGATVDENTNSREFASTIAEKGLRYDLTVPFARYVMMNRHEVQLPFKRYQIQPVWRADRPQKGRYREFYQCDADVVGTDSLICELEIILMIKEVFKALAIDDFTIKINHRGILSGMAESAGARENEEALFVAIDKLEKLGWEKVKEELLSKEFTDETIKGIYDVIRLQGTSEQKLEFLTTRFKDSIPGSRGMKELTEVFTLMKDYGADEKNVEFDVSLARGLSYYTGCIFEVKVNNVAIGSVSGGGRYDNLTQAFGAKEKLSGVGISFGIDRLYDAMEELNIFPPETQASSKVLICHLDEASMRYGLKALSALRAQGIPSEIYPDVAKKINKQVEYANKKGIPYTVVIGPDEMTSGLLAFKHMKSGEQSKSKLSDIVDLLADPLVGR